MCVICIKPSGVKLPEKTLLQKCWTSNPDGAGYMFAEKGKVRIRKGFMSLAEMEADLREFEKVHQDVDINAIPMIFHFRIGTSGGNTPENTHPFPITTDTKALRQLHVQTKYGIAHNGIIQIPIEDKTISDTMTYIQKVLAPMMAINNNFIHNSTFQSIIANTINYSRFAIMDTKGDITMLGSFLKGTKDYDRDYLFSNLTFEYSYSGSYYSEYYYGKGYSNDDYYKTSNKNKGSFLYKHTVKKLKCVKDDMLLMFRKEELLPQFEQCTTATKDPRYCYVSGRGLRLAMKPFPILNYYMDDNGTLYYTSSSQALIDKGNGVFTESSVNEVGVYLMDDIKNSNEIDDKEEYLVMVGSATMLKGDYIDGIVLEKSR